MADVLGDAFASMPPPRSLVPPESVEFVFTPPDARTGTRPPSQGGRGRGRPPGSKNRPKPPELGTNPPQRVVVPPSRGSSTPATPDEAEAKKTAKKERAEQYSTWIVEELNDKVLMMIIGAGVPAEAIYTAGRVPPKAATNPHLTEFGNAIVIPADVADSWGKLFAELSYTDAGAKVTKQQDNGLLTIGFAALTALFSTYRYSQQLKPVLDMIKQAQAAKVAAAQEQENTDGTTGS